jgi:hypothetical protein
MKRFATVLLLTAGLVVLGRIVPPGAHLAQACMDDSGDGGGDDGDDGDGGD